jgi:hypothetical protein
MAFSPGVPTGVPSPGLLLIDPLEDLFVRDLKFSGNESAAILLLRRSWFELISDRLFGSRYSGRGAPKLAHTTAVSQQPFAFISADTHTARVFHHKKAGALFQDNVQDKPYRWGMFMFGREARDSKPAGEDDWCIQMLYMHIAYNLSYEKTTDSPMQKRLQQVFLDMCASSSVTEKAKGCYTFMFNRAEINPNIVEAPVYEDNEGIIERVQEKHMKQVHKLFQVLPFWVTDDQANSFCANAVSSTVSTVCIMPNIVLDREHTREQIEIIRTLRDKMNVTSVNPRNQAYINRRFINVAEFYISDSPVTPTPPDDISDFWKKNTLFKDFDKMTQFTSQLLLLDNNTGVFIDDFWKADVIPSLRWNVAGTDDCLFFCPFLNYEPVSANGVNNAPSLTVCGIDLVEDKDKSLKNQKPRLYYIDKVAESGNIRVHPVLYEDICIDNSDGNFMNILVRQSIAEDSKPKIIRMSTGVNNTLSVVTADATTVQNRENNVIKKFFNIVKEVPELADVDLKETTYEIICGSTSTQRDPLNELARIQMKNRLERRTLVLKLLKYANLTQDGNVKKLVFPPDPSFGGDFGGKNFVLTEGKDKWTLPLDFVTWVKTFADLLGTAAAGGGAGLPRWILALYPGSNPYYDDELSMANLIILNSNLNKEFSDAIGETTTVEAMKRESGVLDKSEMELTDYIDTLLQNRFPVSHENVRAHLRKYFEFELTFTESLRIYFNFANGIKGDGSKNKEQEYALDTGVYFHKGVEWLNNTGRLVISASDGNTDPMDTDADPEGVDTDGKVNFAFLASRIMYSEEASGSPSRIPVERVDDGMYHQREDTAGEYAADESNICSWSEDVVRQADEIEAVLYDQIRNESESIWSNSKKSCSTKNDYIYQIVTEKLAEFTFQKEHIFNHLSILPAGSGKTFCAIKAIQQFQKDERNDESE